jgi:hypothetical protein
MILLTGGKLPGRTGWRQIWGIRTRLRRYVLVHQENYSTAGAMGPKIQPNNTKRRLKGLSRELDWAFDDINR